MTKLKTPYKTKTKAYFSQVYNLFLPAYEKTYTHKHPIDILEYNIDSRGAFNRPLELVEKIIKTGDTVLDVSCGDAIEGLACKQLGRNYIGIDCEPQHIKLAVKMIRS